MKAGDTVRIIGGLYAGREGVIAEISTRGSQKDYPYIVTLHEDKDSKYQVGCRKNELEPKENNQ